MAEYGVVNKTKTQALRSLPSSEGWWAREETHNKYVANEYRELALLLGNVLRE